MVKMALLMDVVFIFKFLLMPRFPIEIYPVNAHSSFHHDVTFAQKALFYDVPYLCSISRSRSLHWRSILNAICSSRSSFLPCVTLLGFGMNVVVMATELGSSVNAHYMKMFVLHEIITYHDLLFTQRKQRETPFDEFVTTDLPIFFYSCSCVRLFAAENSNEMRVRRNGISVFFSSELRWGKAMVAHAKPEQRKKEENERLRGEGSQIKFIDLRFERWQVLMFRKGRRTQDVP